MAGLGILGKLHKVETLETVSDRLGFREVLAAFLGKQIFICYNEPCSSLVCVDIHLFISHNFAELGTYQSNHSLCLI